MKKLFNIIKLILKSKHFVLYTVDKENNINREISSSDINSDCIYEISSDIKNILIQTVGEQTYGEKLDKYDIDLFNAYKECDYRILHAKYLEAELEYYKMANSPTGGDANVLYVKYKQLQKLKEQFENFS